MAINSRNNEVKKYLFDGEYLIASEIARRVGMKAGTLNARLRRGMDISDAIAPVDRCVIPYTHDLDGEIWMPISGYEGVYEVSNKGRVKSLPRRTSKETNILKADINNRNGYCYVHLCDGKKKGVFRVHCLVMNAFNPVNKQHGYDPDYTIDHIDGNKANNELSNLEWCSQKENQRRAWETGLQVSSWTKVVCLETRMVYTSLADAARAVGGNRGEMVARVCRGERSHYRGKHFAFLIDYATDNIPQFKGSFSKGTSETLWQ